MRINKTQLLKFLKAANRKLELEKPKYNPSVIHKTSKKDLQDKKSNNIKNWEDE